MSNTSKKFYLTTSIAYTNTPPHIGYALEIIQADVIARYHQGLGDDVFFLTGTDEHGTKIVRAAEKAGKSPKEFTDEISDRYKELTKILNLSNDDFIRTTDRKRHWPIVQKVWLKLKENEDIYKKKYKGFYCVGCEAFIKEKDLVDGKCGIHQKECELIEEENYFFKLSKYSDRIKEIIEKDEVKIIPETRKNEMLRFIDQGLEDVSFSRPKEKLSWGIPVPDDNSQTIYVWADALINYISVFEGFAGDKFQKYWPPDIHFLGKDILRFHATIWLGMLLSLGLKLPRNIFVHGFITSNGQKMSKSLGNVVNPFKLVKKYGTDAVRYFLLREIPPTEDGDFTYEKFEKRYNSDLAGGLGNLVARTMKLAEKLNIKPDIDENFKSEIEKIKKEYDEYIKNFRFNDCLSTIWKLISFCDIYIEKEKPWEKNQNNSKVISNLFLAFEEITNLLNPFLPGTSEEISKQLKIKKGKSLFPRI